MVVTLKSIQIYAGKKVDERKYVEGQRVLRSKNIFRCGILANTGAADNLTRIQALSVQSSHIKDNPFIINGLIEPNGKIVDFTCTCPAGSGVHCKHIIGTLLYCMCHADDLELLSGTDITCSWRQPHNNAIEQYKPRPVTEHSCYAGEEISFEGKLDELKRKKTNKRRQRAGKPKGDRQALSDIPVESNVMPRSNNIPANSDPECVESSEAPELLHTSVKRKNRDTNQSLAKKLKPIQKLSSEDLSSMMEWVETLSDTGSVLKEDKCRHKAKSLSKDYKVSAFDQLMFKKIFESQDSNLMEMVDLFKVSPLDACCQNVLDKLSSDPLIVCEKTREWFADWLRERMYRITGTTAYSLFTFSERPKLPSDWKKKCSDFINPRTFKTEATEYGKKNEKPARETFQKNNPDYEVVETGLIVCKKVPWLAYSPDAVIFLDGKLVSLLEIKCFTLGQKSGINEVVKDQIGKCLERDKDNKIVMKERHRFYGQVQLGMAVLNVPSAHFVVYSAFDQKIFTLKVAKNVKFLTNVLKRLKEVYFSIILPEISLLESKDDEDCVHRDDKHLDFTVKFSKITVTKANKAKSQSRVAGLAKDNE